MKQFEKHNFVKDDKTGIIGSFIEKSSVRNDSNVEICFSKLGSDFKALPHIHTKTKTIVIILKGEMTFSINNETVIVGEGEYIVFDKGSIEEVVFVKPNTQNLTIHTPSVLGGDKKEL